MKYALTIIAFVLVVLVLAQFEFPLFWKIIAAAIVALGIFFAFESHHVPASADADQYGQTASKNVPSDLSHYLPINEYNKKHGMPSNDIKQKISNGELKGAQVNGIWYIHADEM